uniref:E3 ubiquitin-protein ligase hrd-1 n=1 Tax=Heterorhabditis bacteriophora TaxID=37862 RepID=A0A1I7XIK6_HETBA
MPSRDRTSEFKTTAKSYQMKVQANGNVGNTKKELLSDSIQFSQLAKRIGRDLSHTCVKMEKLAEIARKRSLFDERREIEHLSHVLKEDITSLNKQIAALQDFSRRRNGGVKNQGSGHSQLVVVGLQSKLASVSKDFQSVLEISTENMKHQKSRREKFSQADPVPMSLPSSSSTSSVRSRLLQDYDNGGGSVAVDIGTIESYKSQQQLTMRDHSESYAQARANTMETIEGSISELGQIFSQLASLVNEQGEMITRIDSNVEDTAINIDAAHSELVKYFHNISKNRWLMIKVFGVLMVCYIIVRKLHLSERAWHAVLETCLAFTVFRDDFSPVFVMQFVGLLFVKSFHWLADDRVDMMERSPVITLKFHLRMISIIAFLGAVDSYLVSHAYFTTLLKGASAQIVFGFEYAILMTLVIHVTIKYVLHMHDLRTAQAWENKAVYLLYAELLINLIRCVLYGLFALVMLRVHTFPLFSVRPFYLSIRALHKAFNDVVLSRRAINAMNNLFPIVTSEELSSMDATCIICREEMTAESSPKRLPCSHVFHAHCLRSWFQRQQTCPTCRTDILAVPGNRAANAPIPPQPLNAIGGVQQPPRLPGNFFPFMAHQFAFHPQPQQRQIPDNQDPAQNGIGAGARPDAPRAQPENTPGPNIPLTGLPSGVPLTDAHGVNATRQPFMPHACFYATMPPIPGIVISITIVFSFVDLQFSLLPNPSSNINISADVTVVTPQAPVFTHPLQEPHPTYINGQPHIHSQETSNGGTSERSPHVPKTLGSNEKATTLDTTFNADGYRQLASSDCCTGINSDGSSMSNNDSNSSNSVNSTQTDELRQRRLLSSLWLHKVSMFLFLSPLRPLLGWTFGLIILFTSLFGNYIITMFIFLVLLGKHSTWRQFMDRAISFWMTIPIGFLEFVFGMRVRVSGDEIEVDQPGLIIMNHRTRLDWMYIWSALYQINPWLITTNKISLKAQLKGLPGAGELLLFPEGTDKSPWTTTKSTEFAKKNGLRQLQYLLYPRIAGFYHLVTKMRKGRNVFKRLALTFIYICIAANYISFIYDVTIAYPYNTVQSEIDLVAKGKSPREVHFHIKKIPITEVPRSEVDAGRWLNNYKLTTLMLRKKSKEIKPTMFLPIIYEQTSISHIEKPVMSFCTPRFVLYDFEEQEESKVIRMIFAYANIPYKFKEIQRGDCVFEDYPFYSIPMLEINNRKLGSVLSICRQLGWRCALSGGTVNDDSEVDMIGEKVFAAKVRLKNWLDHIEHRKAHTCDVSKIMILKQKIYSTYPVTYITKNNLNSYYYLTPYGILSFCL